MNLEFRPHYKGIEQMFVNIFTQYFTTGQVVLDVKDIKNSQEELTNPDIDYVLDNTKSTALRCILWLTKVLRLSIKGLYFGNTRFAMPLLFLGHDVYPANLLDKKSREKIFQDIGEDCGLAVFRLTDKDVYILVPNYHISADEKSVQVKIFGHWFCVL